ncbi:hypothetical protein NG776_02620 [Aliarcobacter cryaerophilus]|uniref:hypothetical protein n=2 Tax=Aliarcobacter TaxID=2321111 RepID=UPI003DA61172
MFPYLIKFTKEYLSFIILIPALLGGFWQAFALITISIPYIRFFSASQVLADGLLIILICIPLYVTFILFEAIYSGIKNRNSTKNSNKILTVVSNILGLAAYFIAAYFIFFSFSEEITNYTYIGYLVLISNIFIFLLILLVIFTNLFIKIVENVFKFYKTKKNTYSIVLIIFLLLLFHKINFMPKNLENLNNLPKGNIIYFNDKYIFIENNKNILVVGFDSLLNKQKKIDKN